MTLPDLEALKDLVDQWREGENDPDGPTGAVFGQCADELESAIERLLVGQQEPVAWAVEFTNNPGVIGDVAYREDDIEEMKEDFGDEAFPLYRAAPPVQEAGRELWWAGTDDLKRGAYWHTEAQAREWAARQVEPVSVFQVADPASLGAEAAAHEICEYFRKKFGKEYVAGHYTTYYGAEIESIIRKHQPIKATAEGCIPEGWVFTTARRIEAEAINLDAKPARYYPGRIDRIISEELAKLAAAPEQGET